MSTTTEAERQERREADRRRAAQAVEALKSSEGWRAWLRARSRFHNYSFTNQLLIAMQCPEATHVTGFRKWLELGYSVRRGEKALYIWMPVPPSRKAIAEWEAAGADKDKKPRTRFRMGPVFDRSQVDPLPAPALPAVLEPPISAVNGDDLDWALAPLTAPAELSGYSVYSELLDDGMGGYCNFGRRRIEINAKNSVNQRAKTLVHELSHMLMQELREHSSPAFTAWPPPPRSAWRGPGRHPPGRQRGRRPRGREHRPQAAEPLRGGQGRPGDARPWLQRGRRSAGPRLAEGTRHRPRKAPRAARARTAAHRRGHHRARRHRSAARDRRRRTAAAGRRHRLPRRRQRLGRRAPDPRARLGPGRGAQARRRPQGLRRLPLHRQRQRHHRVAPGQEDRPALRRGREAAQAARPPRLRAADRPLRGRRHRPGPCGGRPDRVRERPSDRRPRPLPRAGQGRHQAHPRHAGAEGDRPRRRALSDKATNKPVDSATVAKRDRDAQLRELADQSHGINTDLGAALITTLANVDPSDMDVARFFVYALLGPDHDSSPYTQTGDRVARIAAGGVRLVIEELRTDVTKTRKDGSRGRLRYDYGDHRDPQAAIAWLWKFIDGAKTAAELYGRALVVIAAEQHASRLAINGSQRTPATRWPSHKDNAAKALRKLCRPAVPAAMSQLERAVERANAEYKQALTRAREQTSDEQ